MAPIFRAATICGTMQAVARLSNWFALAVCALLSGPPTAWAQTIITPTWSRVESTYTPDAMALADVAGSPATDLIVLSEGSEWYLPNGARDTGKATVLATNGSLLGEFLPPSGRDLIGLVLAEQLNTGQYEYLVGEFEPSRNFGAVYALGGGSTDSTTAEWILTPRSYPGYWNMGASSGEVLLGSGRDLVVPAWDGLIQVLQRSDGAVMATYDAFASYGETFYGHVAISDVDGDATREIVAVGSQGGRVIALSPNTDGTMTEIYVSGPNPDGGRVLGSGPAVADIDGDGSPEIIVTYTSPAVIRAFDPINGTGNCEYEWTLTGGASYYWTSPVVGDVDGDGINEVVVMSNDSVLSVLTAEGIASDPVVCNEGGYDVMAQAIGAGEAAWFTPVLADLTGDSAPDILTASYNTLEILDVTSGGASVAYRATESTAAFYPSAVVQPTSGGAAFFVSGWNNATIYRYDLSEKVPTESWSTFMGRNTREGFCCADTSCATCDSGACSESCGGGSCNLVCDVPGCACDFDCTDANNCTSSCEPGTDCTVDCSGTNNCNANCNDASNCSINCIDTNTCTVDACDNGSSCDIDCNGTNNCDVTCDNGSTCNITCDATGIHCDAINCRKGSECLIDCGGVPHCDFNQCNGAQQSCPGDIIVCNRPCP